MQTFLTACVLVKRCEIFKNLKQWLIILHFLRHFCRTSKSYQPALGCMQILSHSSNVWAVSARDLCKANSRIAFVFISLRRDVLTTRLTLFLGNKSFFTNLSNLQKRAEQISKIRSDRACREGRPESCNTTAPCASRS